MKRKLTIFMFGLLLAVGWTNVASAQAYILKADDMADWTYKWLPENATDSVEEYFVEINPKTKKYAAKEVTDPYQIYDLLRTVYMDKRFPGHYYSAYTSDGQRENPTYYGGIDGGWNIPYGQVGTGATQITYPDIVINTNSYSSTTVSNARIYSIKVLSGNTEITGWNYATDGNQPRDGWTLSGTWNIDNNNYLYTSNSSNTITIDGDLLTGYSNVKVEIVAYDYNYYSSGYRYVYVNGNYQTLSSSDQTLSWNMQANTVTTGTTTPTDVLIELRNASAYISNITIKDGNTTLYSWSGSTNGSNLNGAYANKTLTAYYQGYYRFNSTDGGTIRVPAELFTGHNSISVSITGSGDFMIFGRETNNGYLSYTTLNGTINRTIDFPAVVATDTYKPYNDGYTALMLSIKNNGTPYPEDLNTYLGACEFTTKAEVIGYIRDNIKSVKLLTDGLRIGAGDNVGTVFNCDGTYNKFFFLGKGRARKKSSGVLTTIGSRWPSYACEEVPFKFMFEQFSPTGGAEGDQITDFYIEMMDGAVYDVVHDCAAVIQNGHQFSMSGNAANQNYAMSGMNFFIPDYRLKYWYVDTVMNRGLRRVDGRDMNPYMCATESAKLDSAFSAASYFAVNYAAYNPQHAPKVGLYTITLDAEANPCSGYNAETNANYVVNLDWTSSLNEMSGGDVPQTYVIYEVTYDENGVEHLDSITTVENTTTYDFEGKLWPQHDYSETHTYIIMGYPTDSDHPSFIAWSNQDAIVIPGLKDFLALKLDHYESDFDIPNMQNWYRNFLNVSNENEANGLTTDSIYKGYNVFNLMRYEDNDSTVAKQVARIVFENQPDGTVKYTITYVDELGNPTQQIEPYDINKPAVYNEAHTQIIKPAVNITDAYQRPKLGIQDVGYLTVSAKGDIIIQPNGYDVNFLSIKVEAGTYSQTWTVSNGTTWPYGWSVSDGSRWILEDGAYYLEGGGYILISAGVLPTDYTTATVTINAYGDTGKTAKIKVNNETKAILNGSENARDYIWTINNN